MTDRAELEQLREELRQAAIDAELEVRQAAPGSGDWRHHSGRLDAFSLALVLVDNQLEGVSRA